MTVTTEVSVEHRLQQRESVRPGEFQGYISSLVSLWNDVLEHPVRIVELGTYVGNSAFAWLHCLSKAKLGPNEPAFLYTVDINQNDTGSLIEDAKRFNWTKYLRCIKADSIAYASEWTGPVDMVYIDTTHEYVQTRREIEAWLPHIRSGGWLVLDDAVGYPDVHKAFNYCLEVSCKDKFDHVMLFTGPPYTPTSHGLLVAKLR